MAAPDPVSQNPSDFSVVYAPVHDGAQALPLGQAVAVAGAYGGHSPVLGLAQSAYDSIANMNASGKAPDGAGLIRVDASGTVAVSITLGAPPSPNMPVYVVVQKGGQNVIVNGVSPTSGNNTKGGETISFISDGTSWYVLSIAAIKVS